jgi:hypothetical protein
MFTTRRSLSPLLAFSLLAAVPVPSAAAQGRPSTLPAQDPTARLLDVLPADVAERVLAKIAEARGRGLAAEALEQRALKFAARGVAPEAIERSVSEQAERQGSAVAALRRGRPANPSADEIDAGAEAMRQGVDGAQIAALAQSAPSGRSLAVPLAVLGELHDRGLPSDEALTRVRERLMVRASDRELAELPMQANAGEARGAERSAGAPGQGNAGRPEGAGKPAVTGRDMAATRRPTAAGGGPGSSAGGRPAGVPPAAGGANRPAKPATPGKPTTPPRQGPPTP